MIKYQLICKTCETLFDSWFASSKEYEKLKKLKRIDCYNCNSFEVEKSLMSPSVLNSKKNDDDIQKNEKFIKVRNKLKEYQKFIKKNFKYVGENFVYEARSMHYKNKKKSKGIYGSISKTELKELREEGIDAEVIPWVKDDNN